MRGGVSTKMVQSRTWNIEFRLLSPWPLLISANSDPYILTSSRSEFIPLSRCYVFQSDAARWPVLIIAGLHNGPSSAWFRFCGLQLVLIPRKIFQRNVLIATHCSRPDHGQARRFLILSLEQIFRTTRRGGHKINCLSQFGKCRCVTQALETFGYDSFPPFFHKTISNMLYRLPEKTTLNTSLVMN
jgi:hypothetical protein